MRCYPDRSQLGAIVFHCLATVFLAFAVTVILKRIFQRQVIRTDDVIGALNGYLLAALATGQCLRVGLFALARVFSHRRRDRMAAW